MLIMFLHRLQGGRGRIHMIVFEVLSVGLLILQCRLVLGFCIIVSILFVKMAED